MKRLALLSTALSLPLAVAAGPVPASSAPLCPKGSSSATSQGLDARAEKGDGLTASCLALRLPSLDGGELEDALVALGQYGDRHPVGLLVLTQRGMLSRRSLADAVSMLPLSLSDDMQAQLRALEARQDSFRKVRQGELASERRLALQSINSALVEIRGHMPRR